MPIAEVFPEANGGGTIINVSDGNKKFVASIDFTTLSNQSFSADGDYILATAVGSSVPTVTAKIKNIGNNAGCSIGISGGRLVGNVPSTVNSLFGMAGWSANAAPVMGIDIRTVSSDILADVNFNKYAVIVEAEVDGMWTTNVNTPTNSSLSQVNVGIAQSMSTYWTGGVTRPARYITSYIRSEGSAGSATLSSYGTGITDAIGQGTPTLAAIFRNLNQYAINTAPFNSFSQNGGPNKISALYSGYYAYHQYSTPTATIRDYNNMQSVGTGTVEQWVPANNINAGGYNVTSTNDLWAIVGWCKTGNTGTGPTSWAIKKLNIYIIERV
jgi:hypothetical protein